ncbi:hypothetical protein [Psychrosphaera haliotis]|uniref:DUF7668 domain-containing protein n=1 Tax=Psychrosphaera haliotis TaxID=555083 RepID=A0A6N8F788_9GAMM|nr:hypothetical protein [Psychrosphaera haliotis]MUH72024.1 hypothetical protein [Psychrosphaera haliotis]
MNDQFQMFGVLFFFQIVKLISRQNYFRDSPLHNVKSLNESDSLHIQSYIESYGEELIELPIETWDSSIYIWMGNHWNVIIDLWTRAEGRSDLVLSAKVYEDNNEYLFDINMVYVP